MGDIDYQSLAFTYAPIDTTGVEHHAVTIVGAGPVGLTLALDLARHGLRVLVIDDDYRLSTGSRAICFAKRTLDIWDRLEVGERMVNTGVSWNVGRVFFKDDEVWRFDLLPEQGHRRPAFINLQQYYCEGYLHEHVAAHPNVTLRWKNKAVALARHKTHSEVTVDTPDGPYTLTTDWLLACDGARSPLRKMLGQESHGRIFRDRFLIADVRMQADFPTERWFWFDPPFHPGQSVLLHSQPDNIWRIDFQLGWDADPVEEVKPENVLPRIRALLGDNVDFELEWVSIYTFACERMDHFQHGRILFVGDSAHRVSPFGARGANSGVQDADNLAWKLALVVQGKAPESLIDSYAAEREPAADENIAHSTHSTDFITPKSEISLLFRNTVLKLAKHHEFARKLVNSGRLSTPAAYTTSPLNTPDSDDFSPQLPVGAVAPDGPVTVDGVLGWWLGQLESRFALALFCNTRIPEPDTLRALAALQDETPGMKVVLALSPALAPRAPAGLHCVVDRQMTLARRYDAGDGACYLIRPDQHIAARWRTLNVGRIRAALKRATGAGSQEAAS
ncbi:FAD-dependent oxidoreductase [Allopusillimonas soli]|uniref:FAD-dependent oxidoreductase n=1 Tax=Allopusillimonas soli TaxID=659016 RepID=A0A853F9W6_9BURK|nr:FAD-dependent oxidoreductase [Allopusillimonas soli]NYT35720.1 FAD-dependent oxidoreductase [Allopusillimonas soli]TEA76109.1 FAD-dependent oxidoreductase [Allopusillimonas soli]